MRGVGSACVMLAAFAACAHQAAPPDRSTVAYETHLYALNYVPFGAGQFQNDETTKGIGFAIGEGVTAATSAGIWLYLSEHYRGELVPLAEGDRVRRLQQIEVGTGCAFFGLYAWSVIEALVHYEPRVRINDTNVTIIPTPEPGGVGLALSWTTSP